MDLAHLIEALADPTAYPFPVEKVEVRQTHISVVFLAGPSVYKIKKPVNLGFLDFTTLEKRRHFCGEEVRLNRRLAPDVYRGVVAVTQTGAGLRLEGPGEPVEWAVKMERLPAEATLRNHVLRGEISSAWVESLARKIASFHTAAEAGERVASFGRFNVVARNARENFEQSAARVGLTVSREVFDRLQALTEQALVRLRPLIEARAERGVPRDTHGDLHLDHVYLFPERPPPADLVIIDCIEFNERFRFADPVADMAFLVMDFAFHGRRDLARAFTEAYFRASGDEEGRALGPFYTAYRAAVRGKVEGIALGEKEVPEQERARALEKARAHWLLALGELEAPDRRPALVLVGGLPGAGKSTLSRGLAAHAHFDVVRSDVVRKELAGRAPQGQGPFGFEAGIYTPEWTERTYTACLRQVEEILFAGKRVAVDASFREDRWRRLFLETATRWGVPAVFLHCRAEAAAIRARLQQRRGDASDADWHVYLQAAARWEEPGDRTRASLRVIDSTPGAEQALAGAMAVLREFHLQENG
jgi:aminoglycoside phosphotransferase family enzyme/predicted kinase